MEAKNIDLSSLKIDRKENSNSGNTKKTIIYLVTVVVLLIGFYFLIPKFFTSTQEVSQVTVTLVSPSQVTALLNASGYVVAQRKAAVASKGTGRLVFLGVVEGDAVKANQIIARLEDSDIKALLAQANANLKFAEADLNVAENNFKREQALFKAGATTKQSLEIAEANYLRVQAGIGVAKAQVTSAEVALENTLIRAPFDGTVLTKNADVGEIVAPLAASVSARGAVVTMADMTSLQVEVDVSESNIQRIKVGQDCEIRLDAFPQVRYPGYVDKIVPTADRAKATVMVKIGFKNYDSKVLPEMSAKVAFLGEAIDESKLNEKPMLVVPTSAVFNQNNNSFLFTIINDKVKRVEITIGRVSGDYTEIISGVDDGTKVVDNAPQTLKDGDKVSIKE